MVRRRKEEGEVRGEQKKKPREEEEVREGRIRKWGEPKQTKGRKGEDPARGIEGKERSKEKEKQKGDGKEVEKKKKKT